MNIQEQLEKAFKVGYIACHDREFIDKNFKPENLVDPVDSSYFNNELLNYINKEALVEV